MKIRLRPADLTDAQLIRLTWGKVATKELSDEFRRRLISGVIVHDRSFVQAIEQVGAQINLELGLDSKGNPISSPS